MDPSEPFDGTEVLDPAGSGGAASGPAAPAGRWDAGPAEAPVRRNGALDRAMATLTATQREAVESSATALCIVAGAGSGKTRVLTLRVARRIADGSADADHTAVCTFTRKAAGELRQRLRGYGVPVSTPAAPGAAPTPGVRAGTLHQLALTLLRRHAADRGAPPPVVTEHRYGIIRELVVDPASAGGVAAEIGWAKARCLTPEQYAGAAASAGRSATVEPEEVMAAFVAYQAALDRRRSLDLDDVLARAADLVLDDAGFAERMHWRYRHLSVDEFQDVNPAQFRLVRALCGQRDDLCVVGDPNQAIYGWNGADPSLLARLPSLVPGMEVIHLADNHRSSPQVVAAATAGLGPTATPPPTSATPDGPLPVVTVYEDETAEAEGVVSLIVQRSEDGVPWSDQAVLARTHDQLQVVSRALSRAGIPHRMAPGPEAPATGGSDGGDGSDGAGGAVELATFHRAKGLEWTSVHVVGLEEGFVPIVYAEGDEALDEERRLLYVALSRASTDLHCSWARGRQLSTGRRMERQPSPWLADVAQVSRTGSARDSSAHTTQSDAVRRIAEIRASLER